MGKSHGECPQARQLPTHETPEVQQQLAKWNAEIEAMADVEISIDPGSTVCDAFLQKISGVGSSLLTGLDSKIAPSGS